MYTSLPARYPDSGSASHSFCTRDRASRPPPWSRASYAPNSSAVERSLSPAAPGMACTCSISSCGATR